MSWPLVELGAIANFINGYAFKPAHWEQEGKPIIRIQNLTNPTKSFNYSSMDVPNKYHITNGDLLVSWSATLDIFVWNREDALLNQHIFKVEPDFEKIDKDYLRYALRDAISAMLKFTRGSTMKHVNRGDFLGTKIPLPPLDTQKKIAAVLEKADQLRKDCQQMEQELNSLAQSVFIDMFGDPVTNPNGFNVKILKDLVSVLSGATPSKSTEEFWIGDVPWISPKDMKVPELYDAIDHVNEIAFSETNLKSIPLNSILIVVRGMILVHTVPLAITRKKLAINQDIKALTVKCESITSEFLLAALSSMHSHLLGLISTAAHGTKRIDMADLLSLKIIVPSIDSQDEYFKAISVIREMITNKKIEATLYEDNFNSLLQKAFKGELNL